MPAAFAEPLRSSRPFFLTVPLARIGQVAEGLMAIDDALEQCERTNERWNMAELLRVKGELLLLAPSNTRLFRRDRQRRRGLLSRRATSISLVVTFTNFFRNLRNFFRNLGSARSTEGASGLIQSTIVWHYDVSIACRKSDDEKTSAKLRKTGK
jgi:hypothetical protein